MTKMVPLADGSLETRHKINCFKDWLKLNHPEKGIKTKEDAILYAIEQAENSIDLTYDELSAICSFIRSSEGQDDETCYKNAKSGYQKLHGLMERMKGEKTGTRKWMAKYVIEVIPDQEIEDGD